MPPLIVIAAIAFVWWLASPEPVPAASPARTAARKGKATTTRRRIPAKPTQRTARRVIRDGLKAAGAAYIRSAGASDLHIRVASNAGRATRVTASTTDRAARVAGRLLERAAARRWEDPQRWEARWRGAVVKPYTDLPESNDPDPPEPDPDPEQEPSAAPEPQEPEDPSPDPIYQPQPEDVIDAEIIEDPEEGQHVTTYDLNSPTSTALTGTGGAFDVVTEDLPASDAEYLEIAGGIAASINAAAERLTVLHEGLLGETRLDQQSITPLQQLAELLTEAAAVASTMTSAFVQRYEQVREFVADGGTLPRSGDFITGEGD